MIQTVQITGGFFDSEDCIVLKNAGNNLNYIIMALPFHEDTPNLQMTIAQALNLRNAIDSLIDVPLIEYVDWDMKNALQKAEIELSEMDDKYEALKDKHETLQAANKMLLSVIKELQIQFQIISRGK